MGSSFKQQWNLPAFNRLVRTVITVFINQTGAERQSQRVRFIQGEPATAWAQDARRKARANKELPSGLGRVLSGFVKASGKGVIFMRRTTREKVYRDNEKN